MDFVLCVPRKAARSHAQKSNVATKLRSAALTRGACTNLKKCVRLSVVNSSIATFLLPLTIQLQPKKQTRVPAGVSRSTLDVEGSSTVQGVYRYIKQGFICGELMFLMMAVTPFFALGSGPGNLGRWGLLSMLDGDGVDSSILSMSD